MALFLSRGMSAWWAALSALEPRPRQLPCQPSRDGERSAPALSGAHRAELVTVLAGMAMACSEEVTP